MTEVLFKGAVRSMYSSQVVDAITGRTALQTKIITDNSVTLAFPDYGDASFLLQFNQDCSITLQQATNSVQFQKMNLVIQQPASGNSLITFTDDIQWENDKLPFIDMRMGKETILEIISFNGQLRGRKLYG